MAQVATANGGNLHTGADTVIGLLIYFPMTATELYVVITTEIPGKYLTAHLFPQTTSLFLLSRLSNQPWVNNPTLSLHGSNRIH